MPLIQTANAPANPTSKGDSFGNPSRGGRGGNRGGRGRGQGFQRSGGARPDGANTNTNSSDSSAKPNATGTFRAANTKAGDGDRQFQSNRGNRGVGSQPRTIRTNPKRVPSTGVKSPTNNIFAGQDQKATPKPGPVDLGTVQQRLENLKKVREVQRKHAIKNGLISDPTKARSLADAIVLKGTCQDMCPEYERLERIIGKDVWKFERIPVSGPGGTNIDVPFESRMVKKFRRSAAGLDEQLPSDLRPPAILKKTIDYLFNDVSSKATLASCHHFLWDRTRGVRNDFSIQQVSQLSDVRIAIDCFERMARFHIMSLHLLCSPEPSEERYDWFQDREQLDRTLLSLIQYYDDYQQQYRSVNEAEFRAYSIILQIQCPVPDIEDRVQSWPMDIIKDPKVQRALKLYSAATNTSDFQGPGRTDMAPHLIARENWKAFWALVESHEVSYLMACAAEIHFSLVRRTALMNIWKACRVAAGRKIEDWTTKSLVFVLGLDSEAQVIEFCQFYGFAIETKADGSGSYLDLSSVPGKIFPLDKGTMKPLKSFRIVEAKRYRRTTSAIIDGMSVVDARRAGRIIPAGQKLTEIPDNELPFGDATNPLPGANSQSLFVQDSDSDEEKLEKLQSPPPTAGFTFGYATLGSPLSAFVSPTASESAEAPTPSVATGGVVGVDGSQPGSASVTSGASQPNSIGLAGLNGTSPSSVSNSASFTTGSSVFGAPISPGSTILGSTSMSVSALPGQAASSLFPMASSVPVVSAPQASASTGTSTIISPSTVTSSDTASVISGHSQSTAFSSNSLGSAFPSTLGQTAKPAPAANNMGSLFAINKPLKPSPLSSQVITAGSSTPPRLPTTSSLSQLVSQQSAGQGPPPPPLFPIASSAAPVPAPAPVPIPPRSPSPPRPSPAEIREQKLGVLEDVAYYLTTDTKAGFLRQFTEFLVGPMIAQAVADYEQEELDEEARSFRHDRLAARYGHRWLINAHNRKLARRQAERRLRLRASRQALQNGGHQLPAMLKNSGSPVHDSTPADVDAGAEKPEPEPEPEPVLRAVELEEFFRSSGIAAYAAPSPAKQSPFSTSPIVRHNRTRSDFSHFQSPPGVYVPTPPTGFHSRKRSWYEAMRTSADPATTKSRPRSDTDADGTAGNLLKSAHNFLAEMADADADSDITDEPSLSASIFGPPRPPVETDALLFSRLRAVRSALDDGISFYRSECEKSDRSKSGTSTPGIVPGNQSKSTSSSMMPPPPPPTSLFNPSIRPVDATSTTSLRDSISRYRARLRELAPPSSLSAFSTSTSFVNGHHSSTKRASGDIPFSSSVLSSSSATVFQNTGGAAALPASNAQTPPKFWSRESRFVSRHNYGKRGGVAPSSSSSSSSLTSSTTAAAAMMMSMMPNGVTKRTYPNNLPHRFAPSGLSYTPMTYHPDLHNGAFDGVGADRMGQQQQQQQQYLPFEYLSNSVVADSPSTAAAFAAAAHAHANANANADEPVLFRRHFDTDLEMPDEDDFGAGAEDDEYSAEEYGDDDDDDDEEDDDNGGSNIDPRLADASGLEGDPIEL